MNTKAIGGGVLVLGLIVGLWTYGSATNGEITACVGKNGFIRVTSGECKANETALSWNTEGEKGETGEKGDTGEAGASITLDFYIMNHGPFEVKQNEFHSFGIGCENDDDIAIAGGPDTLSATGGGIHWNVFQNRPDGASNDSWLATVLYSGPDPTATFIFNLKCLRL